MNMQNIAPPQQRHPASVPLFAYIFLMDGPNRTIFGMKIDKDNHVHLCKIIKNGS